MGKGPAPAFVPYAPCISSTPQLFMLERKPIHKICRIPSAVVSALKPYGNYPPVFHCIDDPLNHDSGKEHMLLAMHSFSQLDLS
jgi:hypothetical protein